MHGTLEMTYMAVKFNFQQVLLKTLISTMNTLKDMAVLNIIRTDGKYDLEAKREDLEIILRFLIFGQNKTQWSLVPCQYELFKYYLNSGQIPNNLHLNERATNWGIICNVTIEAIFWLKNAATFSIIICAWDSFNKA